MILLFLSSNYTPGTCLFSEEPSASNSLIALPTCNNGTLIMTDFFSLSGTCLQYTHPFRANRPGKRKIDTPTHHLQ